MIIISDFDDTLCPHGDEVTFQENLQAVTRFRAQADNEFVLATGRSLSSLERTFPNFRNYMDFVILDNGSVCYETKNDNVLLEYTISKQVVSNIMKLISSLTKSAGGGLFFTTTLSSILS